MAVNWWLALIIMVVVNGIVFWTLFMNTESLSKTARKWFYIVANVTGLLLVVAQFIWMDF
ncbi:hypothetical protein M6D81_08390 [Paenibacillus sp. J5C_2022]|uniref:hypothetical protein n=1 Tax=Paenibacillus sp. J5C2022 TaxID=2977129 RepID=UPI0021CF229C|nr:hypothetical protein [Paenibacillus sp. J5C2022]MCU6708735.1 hypothetical protein [Paenibacillus sp. J5C2022]